MPRERLALGVIVSGQLLLGIDATIVNVALPQIASALRFHAADLAWVLNAYTVVFAGLLLLGGRLGDVLGRRRMFLAGVGVFTGSSLAAALAGSPGWLLAARAVQGLGAALASPSTLALITTTFAEGPRRNRALGISSAVISGGASLGLVLGGLVTAAASWRWVFLVNVPIGAVILILARRHLPEAARHPGRFDTAGALTGTAGMLAVVYALLHREADARTAVGLVAGVAALAAFVAVEARTARPIMPLTLFRDGPRAAGYASLLLLGPSLIGPFFFLAVYFHQSRQLPPLLIGLAFLPMTAGLFTAARLVPRLLARFGPRRVILPAIGVVFVAGLLLARVGPASPYAAILGPLALLGLSGGAAFIPIYTLVLARVAPAEAGAASGVLQMTQWLGGSLGLAVMVAVAGPDMRRAFLTAAALAVVALAVVGLALMTTTHSLGRLRAGGRERPDGPGHPHEVEQTSALR